MSPSRPGRRAAARRPAAPLVPPLPFLAVLVAALLAPLLAGCGPEAGPIADPREVVTRSVEAVAERTTFRYVAELDGEVPLPAVGAAEAAPVELRGTTVEGVVDVARARGTARMEIPGLGPAFDAIVVGPDLYVRIGLFGGGYTRTSATDSPLAFLSDPAKTLAGIDAALGSLPEPPRKEPDRDCGDGRCYVVTFTVPPGSVADLPGLFGTVVGGAIGSGLGGLGGLDDMGELFGPGASALPLPSLDPSVAAAGGTAELLVRIDDLRPYSLTVRGATADAPSMTVTFDRWDEPVRVEAPGG